MYSIKGLKLLADGGGAYAFAAMEALELITLSRGKDDKGLDLGMETYDFLPIPLMRAGLEMQREGKSCQEIRQRLGRLAAAYELFALYNFLDGFPELSVALKTEPLRSPDPLLQVRDSESGQELLFDVYKVFRQTAEDCFVFADGGMAVEVGAAREVIGEQLIGKLITEE